MEANKCSISCWLYLVEFKPIPSTFQRNASFGQQVKLHVVHVANNDIHD